MHDHSKSKDHQEPASDGSLCDHHDDESPGAQDHGTLPHFPHRHESRGRLILVLVLTSIIMLVELVAGLASHSLALMADAGHMLSDVASQGLALLAIWFASKPPTPGKSYGYHRTEILASLINGVALVGISMFIVYESFSRLANPPAVEGNLMLIVSIVGLAVNMISMRLLHSVADHSLNVKAAYLELVGDMLASGGVLVAAVVVNYTHWYMADPLISLLIGFLILPRTWLLLAECTNILMEGTPRHIDMDGLHASLLKVAGVIDVHDIHVWTITSGLDAMSGHVCIERNASADQVLAQVTRIAQKEYGIQHTTIQIETLHADRV